MIEKRIYYTLIVFIVSLAIGLPLIIIPHSTSPNTFSDIQGLGVSLSVLGGIGLSLSLLELILTCKRGQSTNENVELSEVANDDKSQEASQGLHRAINIIHYLT